MSDTLTVRLDTESRRALRELTYGGRSRSDAVREALLTAVEVRRRQALREEAARIGADPADRAEVAAIRAFMDED